MPPSSPDRHYDALILGGGLAGAILAQTLSALDKSVLLVDDPAKSRCSRVAAGLVNPIGGKRLKLVWMAETLIPFATNYYANLACLHGKTFFHPQPLARLFANADEARHWKRRADDPEYAPWVAPLDRAALPETFRHDDGFLIPKAGYLDTETLLDTVQSILAKQGRLLTSAFAYNEIALESNAVRFRNRTATHAIFCEGHLATENPWFRFVPYKPAKGVIGSIALDQQPGTDLRNGPRLPHSQHQKSPGTTLSVHKGKFLVPRHDGSIAVGATYDWNNVDETPDPSGIQELETFLNAHLDNHWRWLELKAGVRPATAGAYPVIGPHPEHPQLIAFNGFGSKGSLQIPYFAAELAHFLNTNENPLPAEAQPKRFFPKNASAAPKRWIATEQAKRRVLAQLNPGDIAIDATMGNGHDTLWLADAVSPDGHVYAFDIQPSALATTAARLAKANLADHVTLLQRGHESLNSPPTGSLTGKIAAIIFNLGYLPGGDQTIITKPKSTLEALQASLVLLRPSGILSIVLYPCHQGGRDETQAVIEALECLSNTSFQVKIESHPTGNPNSPFPAFVERLAFAP